MQSSLTSFMRRDVKQLIKDNRRLSIETGILMVSVVSRRNLVQ
jgi:hypothetical protein